ncbi:MAG: hypothetical protein K0R49_269 [Burkholderiales bacterium]|jgi:hypothetical protein|nr:hypothetical protein [Burkholderiales bacterium]
MNKFKFVLLFSFCCSFANVWALKQAICNKDYGPDAQYTENIKYLCCTPPKNSNEMPKWIRSKCPEGSSQTDTCTNETIPCSFGELESTK